MPDELKERIQEDVKAAMRARDRARLGVLRLVTAAIKQQEIDNRVDLDDTGVLRVLDRLLKQGRDALQQFESAGRRDLADQESFEIEVISRYLPAALTDDEIALLVEQALAETGAAGMRDMGKVMAKLKSPLQGRADLGAVSALVKSRLAGSS